MTDELVDLARRFLPAGLYPSELGYARRPEAIAQQAARTAALADTAWWSALCRDLVAAFPGHQVEDRSLLYLDRCWRIRVPLRAGVYEHAIVGCVSFLAPLWLPYASLPPSDQLPPHLAWRFELSAEEGAVADVLEQVVSRHREVRRVTPEQARLAVPGVAVDSINLDQATVADCLFTTDRG